MIKVVVRNTKNNVNFEKSVINFFINFKKHKDLSKPIYYH